MFNKEHKVIGVPYPLQLLAILSNLSFSTVAKETSSSEMDGYFGSCTTSMQKESLANAELWKCKPQEQVVSLAIPNTTFSYMLPNYVRIKRCGGTCSPNL